MESLAPTFEVLAPRQVEAFEFQVAAMEESLRDLDRALSQLTQTLARRSDEPDEVWAFLSKSLEATLDTNVVNMRHAREAAQAQAAARVQAAQDEAAILLRLAGAEPTAVNSRVMPPLSVPHYVVDWRPNRVADLVAIPSLAQVVPVVEPVAPSWLESFPDDMDWASPDPDAVAALGPDVANEGVEAVQERFWRDLPPVRSPRRRLRMVFPVPTSSFVLGVFGLAFSAQAMGLFR